MSHVYHYDMFSILRWGCFGFEHFWHIFVTHAIHFLKKLRHFTFILQHLVSMVKNAFSHILLCMLGEIIKKMFLILFLNKKNLYLPPKMKNSNPKGKKYPYDVII